MARLEGRIKDEGLSLIGEPMLWYHNRFWWKLEIVCNHVWLVYNIYKLQESE